MNNSLIFDLYDCKTLYIIGGSTEFFRLSLFDYADNEPIDLSYVKDIEWTMTTYSVKERRALLHKSLLNSEISILKDNFGNYTNKIQIVILNNDTADLHGAFIHQLSITDGDGKIFISFQGLIVIDKYIKL